MAQTIFYSWQSDTSVSFNRNFIEDAIKKAIVVVKTKFDVQEAIRDDNLQFDKDTLGLPGTPPITDSIFDKISKCAIFIPDLTFVGKTADDRLLPNSNVLIEYGYALKAVTTARIIPVMNEAHGKPSDNNLPFNMRHLRNPICYSLEEGSSTEERAAIKKQLVLSLSKAIETVVISGALSIVSSIAIDDVSLKSKVLEFKDDRISKLFHNNTPVPFNTNPKIVFHLIPSSSLSSTNRQLDLRPISSSPATMRPIGSSGWNNKFTFDGFVTYSNSRGTDKSYTYAQ